MSAAPFSLQEDPPHFLDREHDHFTMRRDIVPMTTPRGARRRSVLPAVFEGAHAWPLSWGGKEVTTPLWMAHRDINRYFQGSVEDAGVRMAKRLAGTRVRLFARVEAWRYSHSHNLLEEQTYRFEVVWPDGRLEVLGEVNVRQSLTRPQIRAIADGRFISGANGGRIVIDHDGKRVEINPKTMIALPTTAMYGNIEDKLDVLIEGGSRKADFGRGGGRSSPPRGGSSGRKGGAAPTTKVSPRAVEAKATEAKGTEAKATDAKATEIKISGFEMPELRVDGGGRESSSFPRGANAPSKISYAVDPGAALGRAQGRTSAGEGLVMMVHGELISALDRNVAEDFQKNLARQLPQIERFRRQGDWVRVEAVFTLPAKVDVLSGAFRGPGQYLEFRYLNVLHVPQPTNPDGSAMSFEKQAMRVREDSFWARMHQTSNTAPAAPNNRPNVTPDRRQVSDTDLLRMQGFKKDDDAYLWGVFPPSDYFSVGFEVLKAQANHTFNQDAMRRGISGRCTTDGD